MEECVVLFKNGRFDKMSEKKLKKKIDSDCSRIELIMVPVIGASRPIYIPVKPSRNLLFEYAEVEFVTSVYPIDLDKMDDTEVQPIILPSKLMQAATITEFINILNYGYRVRGYSLWTCECEEAYPSHCLNAMMIDGISIRTYKKDGSPLYRERALIDFNYRIGEFRDYMPMGSTRLVASDMLKDLEIFDDFIYASHAEGKHHRERYLNIIELRDGQWKKRKTFRSDRIYFMALPTFNNYLLTDGNLPIELNKLNELVVGLVSIISDKEFLKSAKCDSWDDPDVVDYIKNCLLYDPYALQYYESYTMYANRAEEILEVVIYSDVFLEYARYILDGVIFESTMPIEQIKSVLTIANPEGVDPRTAESGVIVLKSDDDISYQDLMRRIYDICVPF